MIRSEMLLKIIDEAIKENISKLTKTNTNKLSDY